MTNLKSLFSHVLLAAALLASAGLASATPTYHVDIQTDDLIAANGNSTVAFLDLYFMPFGYTDPITATVSNLHGTLVGAPTIVENVTINPDGSLVLLSDAATEFRQQFTLGDLISFDISFSGMPNDVSSMGFGAGIINGTQDDYLRDAISFNLQPDAPPVGNPGDGTTVIPPADVPEPSTLLSLFTGLGMMGYSLRRRMR